MKKILIISLGILAACNKRESFISHESGMVVSTNYFPDTRQTNLTTGMSSGGHLVIGTTSTGEDEKYMIIFHCSHDAVFSINSKYLYGKLRQGDTVTIDYYNILNKKNQVVNYEFVDANKKYLDVNTNRER